MLIRIYFNLFLLLIIQQAVFADGPMKVWDKVEEVAEEKGLKVGMIYRFKIDELHPTQSAVGVEFAQIRAKKIKDMGEKELSKWLEKNAGKVVLGPGKKPWIVDGHHLAVAMQEEGYHRVPLEVVEDWSKYNKDEFKELMVKNHYCYLIDPNTNKEIDFFDLPSSFSELKNDRYRTLVGMLKQDDILKDNDVLFGEFYNGEDLRKILPPEELSKDINENFEEVVNRLKKAYKAKEAGELENPTCTLNILKDLII